MGLIKQLKGAREKAMSKIAEGSERKSQEAIWGKKCEDQGGSSRKGKNCLNSGYILKSQ